MKFRWDKKYLYWGVTAFLVISSSIGFYYLIFHHSSLKTNLYKVISVAMPIIDGIIVAYLLSPIVNFLERKLLYPLTAKLQHKFPALEKKKDKMKGYCRGISIILTFIIVFFAIFEFFQVVIPQIATSIQTIGQQFPYYVENLTVWIRKILSDNPDIEKAVSDLITHYSRDFNLWINETLLPQMNTLLRTISLSMIGFAKALWNLIIGLIISIYLLVGKERFLSQSKKVAYAFLDTRHANIIIEDARLINRTFGGFISGKLLDSLIIGIICFICVNFMKMPYPMLISVIIGVTNIIPFFGPFIGAVPCALLVLMVNPMQCLYFIIFIVILQQFDGNFLGPKILGDSTGLAGFWIIFSITIFSGLMGVAGMILGVPIFAVLYALLKRKINRNLKRKGMPTATAEYEKLEKVDLKTGDFREKQPVENTDNTTPKKKWFWTLKEQSPDKAQEEPAGKDIDSNN